MKAPRNPRKKHSATIVRPVFGWREWLALPDFGIACIQARIDPSTRLSLLHAEDILYEEIDGRDGVRFGIRPIRDDDRTLVTAAAPLVGPRWDGSSPPVIRTQVTLAAETWPVDFCLVDGDVDGYRLRLGRRAFYRRFAVDPAASFIAGPPTVFLPGLL